jgi:phosphoserine phosphatase
VIYQKDEAMDEKRDFVMVTVSGPDQPGITAAFSKILVDNQVEIVDIEQASLQDFLGLSFLLDMSGAKQSKDGVLKDLLFEASRLHLTLNFRLFSEKEMKARNSKNLFILTYFGDTLALARSILSSWLLAITLAFNWLRRMPISK